MTVATLSWISQMARCKYWLRSPLLLPRDKITLCCNSISRKITKRKCINLAICAGVDKFRCNDITHFATKPSNCLFMKFLQNVLAVIIGLFMFFMLMFFGLL